jgi:hypothetical protein
MRLFIYWVLCALILLGANSCGTEFSDQVRSWFGIDEPDWNSNQQQTPETQKATVTGTVHIEDSTTGAMGDVVENAAVFILASDSISDYRNAVVREDASPIAGTLAWDYTDAQGNFSLADVPYGTYTIYITRFDPIGEKYVPGKHDGVAINSSTVTLTSTQSSAPSEFSGGGSGGAGELLPASIRGKGWITGQPIAGAIFYVTTDLADTGAAANSLPPGTFPPNSFGHGTITLADGTFVVNDIFNALSLPLTQTEADVRIVVVKNQGTQKWSRAVTMHIMRNLNYIITGADNDERIQLNPVSGGI